MRRRAVQMWCDFRNPTTLDFTSRKYVCLVFHLSTVNQPNCLKGLTDIEEMLIVHIKPVMHVRYTIGRVSDSVTKATATVHHQLATRYYRSF